MDAPQSGEDVEGVVRELRLLDPRLGVRWEPRAVMTKRGGYTATGGIYHPEYRGLWEVILDDKAFSTAEWRSWTRVCLVTKPMEIAPGVNAMVQDGEYAPLGPWLVAFLRQADTYNQEGARQLQRRLDQLNERYVERIANAGDDAVEEAASKQYHAGTKAGGGVSEFHPVLADTSNWRR